MDLQRIEKLPDLPPRPADSHKGRFGTVLIIGGSRGMAGAAALCGASALRSGAGLVRIATPAEVQPTVASFEPSYMTYPLATSDEGMIDLDRSLRALERLVAAADVVAVGPGLGQSDGNRELVRWLIHSTGKPLVVDADGLNVLAGCIEILAGLKRPVILTPHPGEFGRLSGMSIDQIQADRVAAAAHLAGRYESLVVVLKGHGTVVCDGHRYYINQTGNPGMASGGTGDVLTGVIAALLGQHLAAFDAAQLGVHIHGLAGDIARDQNGMIGMIASDIVDALPDAFDQSVLDPDLGL